jgi:Glyoxalase-like domain
VSSAQSVPTVWQVVLDTADARGLAEFYRQLLGFVYRQGDEPPPAAQPDPKGRDWLVIQHASGAPRIAFQQVETLARSTWPRPDVPQQLHLDLMCSSTRDFEDQCTRAMALGATLILDRSEQPREPLRVYADPAGHPFCLFTWV